MAYTFTSDLASFRGRVDQQISAGRRLMGRLGAELPKRLLPQLKNWHERNTMLLDASFKSDSVWSGSPAVDYRQYMTLPLIKPVDMIEVEEATAEILRDTLETLISRLETISEIADTFPASGPATAPAAPGRRRC